MSSSTPISNFVDASTKVLIYCGIPILIAGVIGGLLNVIIFRSSRYFRQSSCIFYLTIMSIVDIGQLITGLFPQIMTNGFNIDWTKTSVFCCKLKWYCLYVCALISFTCMCFATIDRFLATCPSRRWQKWSHIKVAHFVTIISICIWLIYGIPYLIYVDIVNLSPTGIVGCIAINQIFYQYHYYSSIGLLGGLLPILINALFGLLLYLNLQHLDEHRLPLHRREFNRELSMIVFVQIIYNFISIIPFIIVTILVVDLMIKKDPLFTAKLQFASVITTCLYFLNFSVSICNYRFLSMLVFF